MKRTVYPDNIKNVSKYMLMQAEKIRESKKRLESYINEITNISNGVDFEMLKLKYLDRVSILENVIANYENYSKYFNNISDAYSSNLKEAVTNFNEVISEYKKESINNYLDPTIPIINQTLGGDIING